MSIAYGIRKAFGSDYYDEMQRVADGGQITENFFTKALTAGTPNAGAEFIPKSTSAEIIMYLYEENWARQLFGTWTMAAKKEDVPKFTSGALVYGIDEIITLPQTDQIPESDLGTDAVKLELKTLAVNVQVQNRFLAYNANRNIAEKIVEAIKNAMLDAEEDAIVNGDTETGNGYQDNINGAYDAINNPHGVNATNNTALLQFDGLRKLSTGLDVDAGGNSIEQLDFRTAFKNLGKYGRRKGRVAFLISPDMEATALGFEQLETLEKYGPNATIMTGEIGKLWGAAVITSNKLPSTENNSLVDVTGVRNAVGGNDFTMALAVYIDSPLIGVPNVVERTFHIQKKDEPEFDRKRLIAIQDLAFNVAYEEGIVKIINVSPTVV